MGAEAGAVDAAEREVKALSIRQPWAWLILYGGKAIENRRWSTHYRGEFLIHAAQGMTRAEYEGAVQFAREVDPRIVVPPPSEIRRGGIVGRARLVDVLPPCAEFPCAHPWHMPGQFGFVLADVAPVPFRPLRGMLGFFAAGGAT